MSKMNEISLDIQEFVNDNLGKKSVDETLNDVKKTFQMSFAVEYAKEYIEEVYP